MPEELNVQISEDFKRLADQVQDAIYHYDVAPRTFLFMNKSSMRLYGFDDSEFARLVTPKTVLLHIHPEDRDAVRKASAESLKPGFKSGEIEYRFLHHDGSIRWMHDRWIVLRDASGAAVAVEGIVRDITGLKETEAALVQRDSILAAVGTVAERVLRATSLDEEVFGNVLETLGQGAGVSRVYVFENRTGGKGPFPAVRRYEWTAPGIAPHTRHGGTHDFPWQVRMRRWKGILAKGRFIQGPSSTFPVSEQGLLASEGIQSIVVMPIFVKGTWWGFIGFDECRQERVWSGAEIDALKTAAAILGALLERKQAEEAFREYEQRFRRIAEMSPLAISMIDPGGRYVYVNRKFVDILGYTLEDIPTGREWFRSAFPDPAYRRQARAAWISDVKTGRQREVVPREFRVTRKDGTVRHMMFRPVVLEDGSVFIMYEDLTERKLTEERLRTSEERYRSVVQNIGIGVAVIGPNMQILSMNRQMETWFPDVDTSKNPICYKSFNNPPGRDICSYCPTFRTLRDGSVYEAVTDTPLGDEIRNYRIISSPLTDDQGRVVAAIEMVDDITERQRAEERFFKAFRMNPLPVSLSRMEDAYYLDINEAFLDLFGYRRKDVVGHTAFDLDIWVDRTDRMRLVQALEAGKPVRGMEVRFRTRKGESRIGSIFSERIVLGGTPCLLSIYEDVTKRKHAEKEIQRLSRELMRSQENVCKRLARDLHDECGQSLTALHLGMEALQDSLPRGLETQKKRIRELTGFVERVGDTIRNISHELRPGILDDLGLVPALSWYIEDFARRAPGLEVDFSTLGFKKRLDPPLEIALYRMVQEGLTNIARHAKARHARVSLTHSHPNVILTITDDGVGFGDVSSASNRGIGLLGMRERVASLGGLFEIRSRKGKGTMLRAELPAVAIESHA